MTPDIALLLVNFGYCLMLMGFLARDILWLRGLLLLGQSCVAAYGFSKGAAPVAGWNSLFALINTAHVIQIIRERRKIAVPEELRDLYEKVFAAFAPVEFINFWRYGSQKLIEHDVLIREGEMQAELICLLSGQVLVEKNGQVLARLGRGRFLAEMSFLNNEPSSANVRVDAPVGYITWEIAKLKRLKQSQPAFWIKLQSVLGHDLIEKLKSSSGGL